MSVSEDSADSWRKCRVVVTGAGGFIGSHLCERLLGLGAQVTALVHGDPQYHPGHLRSLSHPALALQGGDLRDADWVRRSLQGAEVVFHLGAVTSVAYAYAHPEEALATNGLGTLHVCAGAREAGVRRLVHTSSAGVYGNARNEAPIDETHPVVGANPYTSAKLAGDFTAQTYYLSYDVPVTTLRLFNVYGPRMGRFLIMPHIIEQLLAGPVLRLGDLSPTRTFTYVDDIVDGFLAIAMAEDVLGEVVHLGSEEVVTMRELVERIAAIMERSCDIQVDATRLRPGKSEIFRVSVDSGKAERLLGWRPRVSLDEGLRRTIAWFEKISESVVNA